MLSRLAVFWLAYSSLRHNHSCSTLTCFFLYVLYYTVCSHISRSPHGTVPSVSRVWGSSSGRSLELPLLNIAQLLLCGTSKTFDYAQLFHHVNSVIQSVVFIMFPFNFNTVFFNSRVFQCSSKEHTGGGAWDAPPCSNKLYIGDTDHTYTTSHYPQVECNT